MTDADFGGYGPEGEKEDCRRGRNARVLKYTEVTFVWKTDCQSSTFSRSHTFFWRASAELESGGALGPEMPALVTKIADMSDAPKNGIFPILQKVGDLTEEVEILLTRLQILDQLLQIRLGCYIARSNSVREDKTIRVTSTKFSPHNIQGLNKRNSYGIILPPDSGLCDLAAFSSTSIRRPVMYTLAPARRYMAISQ